MESTQTLQINNKAFGCCHRYRQCSDAKRCLLQDEDTARAKLCLYRPNLEQGKIFYGKNANDFSIQEYNALLATYNKTEGNLRCTLNDIILHFVGNSRLSSQVIWFYTNEIEQLNSLGVIDFHRNHKQILEKYLVKELKSYFTSNSKNKVDLVNDILNNHSDLLIQLTEPYCNISIPPQNRRYINELYYDYFYTSSPNRYLGVLPFTKKVDEKNGV